MMSRDSRDNRDRSGDRDHYDSITGRDRDGNDRDHGGDNDFDHGYERDRDQVRFTLNGDKVTNVQEYDDGVWQAEHLEKGETWTFDGTNLTGPIKGLSQPAPSPVPDWFLLEAPAPDPCQRRRSRPLLQPLT